jgi:cell division protein FtsB
MSDSNQTTLNELRQSLESVRQLRYSALTSVVLMLAGGAIIVGSLVYSITRLRPLERQLAHKQDEIQKAEAKITEINRNIVELNERINNLKGITQALLPDGKRRQAIILALDLKERNIQFKMGGRQPEEGFDLSGFIVYILSQPQIGIIKNPTLCDQPCLMNNSGIIKAATLAELKPGDLIFYEYNHTMMYLGGEKCIGMIYEKTIEIRDVHFGWKILGYGKVPYAEDFTGKFGIPLETDEKLEWAKTNVHVKGKANGFDKVYVFKDADGYRTVAIFDSWGKANENLPLAIKVNKTANEIKDFSVWCSTPRWIENGGYFDCLK